MSNLLVKRAVKYSKFNKIGIVDLDGPLIAFQCAATNAMCSSLDIEFTKSSLYQIL